VPQELSTDAFETVWSTVKFSRGLFGKSRDPAYLEKTLRSLSLWDKRDAKIMTLSGGMKRRVLIAKALSHEPQVLFLDEPTAGVDVELRHEMWKMVRKLREGGVTIILTTHYIQEAQEMADRIGVINKGELLLVEDKEALMRKLGKRKLVVELAAPLDRIPDAIASNAELDERRRTLTLTFDTQERAPIAALVAELGKAGVEIVDVRTSESSLEDIFVNLVKEAA
jgi:ABC-2 type transport system ATP-binding protein